MQSVQLLAPHKQSIERVLNSTPLVPFEASIIAFLDAFSSSLLQSKETRSFSELVALGFWLRKTKIKKLGLMLPQGVIKPIGVVTHFTPSNVDTMFIYSWVCSLLMGNVNLIRVSTKESEVKAILFNLLNTLMQIKEFESVYARNIFINYDRDSILTRELSLVSDARVIWGGDESVNLIKSFPTKPRCRDICFADRYSVCLIDARSLKEDMQAIEIAELLWRDTQPHDQKACASPKIVLWMGDTSKQQLVYKAVNSLAKRHKSEIDKRMTLLLSRQLLMTDCLVSAPLIDDQICVMPSTKITPELLNWHFGRGLFLHIQINSLTDITEIVSDKIQTLSYWGVSKQELVNFVKNESIQGLARVVPLGKSLEFSKVWDGYDLFEQLSYHVAFEE